MNITRCALILMAMALNTFAADVAGSWTVKYVSGVAHKTIGSADFDFKVDGGTLSGTASIGVGWPGVAAISKGKVDGDRISFTVIGEQPSTGGIPIMKFAGTVHGNELDLTMTFFYNTDSYEGTKTEMKGGRVTK